MTAPDRSPEPTGAEPSHRRLDARRNHEKVIAAARELFGEHGLQVTVPQVAERAGVGRATVYRSYPSKDDLILTLAREQLRVLEHRTLTALDDTDVRQALRDYVPDLFERLAQDRVLATVFFEARLAPASHLLDLVGRLFEAAKPSGRIRADADQLDVRVVLCGTIRQLIMLDQWDPALWRRYGEMVLNAFRA
ncbi:TetR/AcrR family transcriptional regulator [Micromonospora sp. 15K316]|uniref:TetR/AcrR family transcriptional regulator n=1 Tax=Micromonospora sp. 15K316 TaxID=2530376 RepID=UPI00104C81B4|nr:TetR/AcrR family transcriptional regulator [Micromonospora sp. 15K316]TDC34376.1 TetR/AcrR family transcriptional regulator [Micromonospora sp. 15K316]